MRALLLATILLILMSVAPGHAAPRLEVGQPAPALQLSDGRSLTEVAAGRPILVLFWASWCPYCKALMPHLQSMLDEYGFERLEVLAISFREDDPNDARQLIDAQGFDFITEFSGEDLAASWGATGTPRVYLVSADGRLLYDLQAHETDPNRRFLTAAQGHSGRAARTAPWRAAQLREAVDAALAEVQPDSAATPSEAVPATPDTEQQP